MDPGENEPFDPLADGRAGDPASHVTLWQRGKVLLQLREQMRRRESYSVHTRRVSSAMLGHQVRKPSTSSHRRFVMNQDDTSMSVLGTGLGTIQDGVTNVSQASTPPSGARVGVPTAGDTDALVASAVLALWTNFRIAMGFRQWKEATRGPTDLSKFGDAIDLNAEARCILLAAESARKLALHRANEDQDDDDDDEPVLSPRALDTMGIQINRSELDLLIVWARQVHSKTFRSADDASISEAMRCLRFTTYQDGEPLFYEGDVGGTFYIIFHGTVAVFVGMQASAQRLQGSGEVKLDWTMLGRRVFTYRTGDSFGVIAMFSDDATRTASAIAVGPCEVLRLHRDVYQRTLRKYHKKFVEQAQKLNFIQRVYLFRELPRHKLTALADLLEKRRLQFGDTLITEKASVHRHCYLVLSGVLKATQTVDVPVVAATAGLMVGGGSDGASVTRRKPGVVHRKLELQTIVANEIAVGEILFEPPGTRAAYTLTAASAHVEVYVLRDSDGRSFLGGTQSAMAQRLKKLCDAEASQRERRRVYALQTLKANAEEISEAEPVRSRAKDSLDIAVEAPDSPRHGQHGPVPPVPGLLVVHPPLISDGQAPYLPNLRGSYLLSGDSNNPTLTPRERWQTSTISTGPSDVSVVASPKMLSSCVKKFLFEHSDALTGEYVERLSHQFPTPPPPLANGSHANGSKTQREERRVLEQQLAKMHDSKMHWDPNKKDFALGSANVTTRRNNPGDSRGPGVDSTVSVGPPPASKDARDAGTKARKNTFQQELKATQQAARKLVELHLQRVSPRQQPTLPSAEGSSAFLHFFAEKQAV